MNYKEERPNNPNNQIENVNLFLSRSTRNSLNPHFPTSGPKTKSIDPELIRLTSAVLQMSDKCSNDPSIL